MTDTPGTKSFAWKQSDQIREQEQTFETRMQARQSLARREQAGWAVFAVAILLTVAAFQIFNGFAALLKDDVYQVRPNGLPLHIDYSVWGWFHLGLGALAALAALGLLSGRMWARVLGVGIAWLSMMVNFVFIPAYPFLAVTVIVLDILVIYAIVVYGGALEDDGF